MERSAAVTDVEVVFVPRPHVSNGGESDLWYDVSDYARLWDSSLGNSCADWLKHECHTPAFVFERLMARGFSSRAAMVNALEAFRQIEEADWAREMMRAFG